MNIKDMPTIEITRALPKRKSNTASFMEIWNPTLDEVIELIPYLEKNRKILYIWCYGRIEDMVDFSEITSNRVVTPVWFAYHQQFAYDMYSKDFNQLVSDTRHGFDFD